MSAHVFTASATACMTLPKDACVLVCKEEWALNIVYLASRIARHLFVELSPYRCSCSLCCCAPLFSVSKLHQSVTRHTSHVTGQQRVQTPPLPLPACAALGFQRQQHRVESLRALQHTQPHACHVPPAVLLLLLLLLPTAACHAPQHFSAPEAQKPAHTKNVTRACATAAAAKPLPSPSNAAQAHASPFVHGRPHRPAQAAPGC